jgi:hypothetical protein
LEKCDVAHKLLKKQKMAAAMSSRIWDKSEECNNLNSEEFLHSTSGKFVWAALNYRARLLLFWVEMMVQLKSAVINRGWP